MARVIIVSLSGNSSTYFFFSKGAADWFASCRMAEGHSATVRGN